MGASARNLSAAPDQSSVLSKAVARAAERLDISRALLAKILGVSPPARQWLNSQNRGLNGRPVDLIRQTEGLARVVYYLDASRGHV